MPKSEKKKGKTSSKPKDPTPTPPPKKTGSVRLKDLSGRLQVFNLPHDVYCAKSGKCLCKKDQFLDMIVKKDGMPGLRRVEKLVCASLTLLAKSESEALHESITECPDVQSAMLAKPNRIRILG